MRGCAVRRRRRSPRATRRSCCRATPRSNRGRERAGCERIAMARWRDGLLGSAALRRSGSPAHGCNSPAALIAAPTLSVCFVNCGSSQLEVNSDGLDSVRRLRRYRTVLRFDLQPAGRRPQRLQERVRADRRAAHASPRPDSEPGRDRQGLHQARARDARGGHRRAQQRGQRPEARGREPGRSGRGAAARRRRERAQRRARPAVRASPRRIRT